MGERAAAPRESASPPFGKLVFGSFPMFPSPGFPGRKARHLGRGFETMAPARPHRYSRIAVRKRQWDRRLLGQWTGALISYFLPKLYTVRAGSRKCPGLMARELAALFFFKPLTREGL